MTLRHNDHAMQPLQVSHAKPLDSNHWLSEYLPID